MLGPQRMWGARELTSGGHEGCSSRLFPCGCAGRRVCGALGLHRPPVVPRAWGAVGTARGPPGAWPGTSSLQGLVGRVGGRREEPMMPQASCVAAFHIWEGHGANLFRVALGPLGEGLRKCPPSPVVSLRGRMEDADSRHWRAGVPLYDPCEPGQGPKGEEPGQGCSPAHPRGLCTGRAQASVSRRNFLGRCLSRAALCRRLLDQRTRPAPAPTARVHSCADARCSPEMGFLFLSLLGCGYLLQLPSPEDVVSVVARCSASVLPDSTWSMRLLGGGLAVARVGDHRLRC